MTNRILEMLDRDGAALYRLLYRLTLDKHAADDLLQELFLKLSAGKTLERADNLGAYARQTAIHLALDWRKRRARETVTFDGRELPDPSLPVLARMIEQEEWTRILDGAAMLSSQTREVFVLHYLQQESFEAIALQMGKTAHQVRALAHKAIMTLREENIPATYRKEGLDASE